MEAVDREFPTGEQLLREREQTHGNYSETAHFAQVLKLAFRGGPNWGQLSIVQKESIEQSCTKFARIMCGDPDDPDHWRDISGYCLLVAMRL